VCGPSDGAKNAHVCLRSSHEPAGDYAIASCRVRQRSDALVVGAAQILAAQVCAVSVRQMLGFIACRGSSGAHSRQSSPNSSAGWGARTEPLPQFLKSAKQYLSQPQQTRCGFAGCSGNFFTMGEKRHAGDAVGGLIAVKAARVHHG